MLVGGAVSVEDLRVLRWLVRTSHDTVQMPPDESIEKEEEKLHFR